MDHGGGSDCGLCRFQVHTLNHLPLKDYRAYAVGESIIENRKSAEELGLQGPVFATEYTFRNVNTGVDTVVLSSDWLKIYNEPWFKSTYETVSFDGKGSQGVRWLRAAHPRFPDHRSPR